MVRAAENRITKLTIIIIIITTTTTQNNNDDDDDDDDDDFVHVVINLSFKKRNKELKRCIPLLLKTTIR